MKLLVIPVLYKSVDSGIKFVENLRETVLPEDLEVVVADNSPHLDERLVRCAKALDGVAVEHFPDNPGYMGAGRRVLGGLVAERGQLDFDAVVLCNTDLELQGSDLKDAVAASVHDDPQRRWVLAPSIQERDGSSLNPHMLSAPTTLRSLIQFSLGFTYVTALAYRLLWRLRGARRSRPNAPAGTTMFAPHGCIMIFGAGYFTAGGTFMDGPLFNEELAVGRMAEWTETPVIYQPLLSVVHDGMLTTGSALSRRRYELARDAWRFYRHWHPRFAAGTMTKWFRQAG